MILFRLFVVLAAVALVAAFALASLVPPDMPFGQVAVALAPHGLDHLRTATLRDAPFAWNTVAVPVLARPCWVIPAAIGIVAGGLSISLRPRPRGARRRRTGSGRS